MTLRGFVLALVLLVPTVARAEPISVGGMWSSATLTSGGLGTETLGLTPFWDGDSWDGLNMGVSYLLADYGVANLEYLNDGSGSFTSFRFEEDIFNMTRIGGITSWTNGSVGRRADGAFTYDTGTGFVPITNSWDNPEQFALFRLVTPETIHYFLGIEDIPLSFGPTDRDYNDHVVRFETPHSVPEPGTLLLLASGMAAFVARRKLTTRKARGAAAV
jgi:hypothetical protein